MADTIGSVIVFCSISLAVGGGAGPASTGLLVTYSLLVPVYLAWVVKFVADIENYMNAVERVLEYTGLEKEENPRKYPQAIQRVYDIGQIR